MSRFVRQSKVRHLFGTGDKKENTYTHLRLSSATGDGQYIKANSKYFAVSYGSGGGGACAVIPFGLVGALPTGYPMIRGHKSAILDFDFSPFNDTILATASDDCTSKIWSIPDGGLKENMTEPLCVLDGHLRKVNFALFHPTAENVIATASADHTVKIWDAGVGGAEKVTLEGHTELVQDLKWSYDGSTLATSSKDKLMRLYDARAPEAYAQCKPHEGSKCFKVCFLGNTGNLVTVGFTRQSKRQFKIWDSRNLDKCIKTQDLDQASGVIMPHFDESNNVLYLAGKGDGNIRYFEISDKSDNCFSISEYRSSTSQKGVCFLPKRNLNILKCEVQRALKLTSNTVESVSFTIPRKSDRFQPDLFPDCYAGVPAMTADEYFGGKNANPPLVSLDPAKGGKVSAGAANTKKARMSYIQIESELKKAQARIAELEAEVAKLKA